MRKLPIRNKKFYGEILITFAIADVRRCLLLVPANRM